MKISFFPSGCGWLFLSFRYRDFLDDDFLIGPVLVVGPAARGRPAAPVRAVALLARAVVRLHPLDLLHHLFPGDHLAEDRVVAVQVPVAAPEADEELAR